MSDIPFSTRPLHLQLREALIKRIADGEWRAGNAIPNEIELAREYGLSAGTVRKALDWMESAQLVVRQQGRGTFVRDQTSREILTRFSNFRNPDGTTVMDEVSSAQLSAAEADDTEAARLQMAVGERVYRIVQTRVIDGRAFALENIVLPAALYPNLKTKSPAIKSIGEVAAANGILLGNGREVISIAAASGDVAAGLDVAPGAPVLVLDRIIETIDGHPAEWRKAWCHLGSHVYLARTC